MYFLELTKMTEFMKKTIKRKKYLFWYDSDEKTEIEEFRVCDCFLDLVLNFKNELNIVGEFCDNLKELFLIKYLSLISMMTFFCFLVRYQSCVVDLHYFSLITENLFWMIKYIMIA